MALPVIGAGSGSFEEAEALRLITRTLEGTPSAGLATIVRYRAQAARRG
jgi:hypothetical protein